MKLSKKWIAICLVTGVVSAPIVAVAVNRAASSREFERELRLAQTEGIPLTGEAYAALITPAKLEKNAAPYYQRLKTVRNKGDLGKAQIELLLNREEAVAHECGGFADCG